MSDFINAVKAQLTSDAFNASPDTTTIYTPSGSKDCVVLSVSLCNITANDVTVDIQLDAATDAHYVKSVTVPGGSTLEMMTGQKYVIKNGETLRARASANTAIDLIMNGLEQA